MPVRDPLPKAARPRAIVLGLICVALAYIAGSLALDDGSLWMYFITIGLLIYGVHHFWHALDSYAKITQKVKSIKSQVTKMR